MKTFSAYSLNVVRRSVNQLKYTEIKRMDPDSRQAEILIKDALPADTQCGSSNE
jgi:hypothetical protein